MEGAGEGEVKEPRSFPRSSQGKSCDLREKVLTTRKDIVDFPEIIIGLM
jgi:hypothetical protein